MERETKVVKDKTTGISVNKAVVKQGGANSVVCFLDESGYQNPYQYLLFCYAKSKTRAEQVRVLAGLLENAVSEQQRRG